MAITTESKTITETKEVVTATICDLCKQPFKPMRGDHVEVERTRGCQDGGTTETFDVCVECWSKTIVPFFARHGSSPRLIEW